MKTGEAHSGDSEFWMNFLDFLFLGKKHKTLWWVLLLNGVSSNLHQKFSLSFVQWPLVGDEQWLV